MKHKYEIPLKFFFQVFITMFIQCIIAVQGSGAQSLMENQVRLSSTFLDFDIDGDTTLANKTDSLSLWIYNGKTQPISITSINFSDSVFSPDRSNFTIQSNDSALIWIRFSTTQNVTWNDVGIIESMGGNSALVFRVKASASYTYLGNEARYRPTQNLWGNALKSQLQSIASQGFTQVGYSNRLPMFTVIDNWRVNGRGSSVDKVACVYTDRVIESFPQSTATLANAPWNFNTEHTWPQSRFSQNEPMRSDYHHLFPSDVSENARRADYPFDVVTNASNINGGSRFGTNAQGVTVYEPRDFHKGRVSRSMLYFVTRYQNFGNFWFDSGVNQEATFRVWNRRFPPDSIETRRNTAIQVYQNNRNPFIDHPEFVDRIAAFTGDANFPSIPEIAISPLSLNFGNVGIGDSLEAVIAIVNQGNATLLINSLSGLSSPFSLVNTVSTVSSKDVALITIRFKPESISNFNAALFISSNDTDEPTTTVTLSGQSTFAVPVELTNFTASTSHNGVLLQWTTSSELNNQGFHVERRTSSENWIDISFVNGHGTTSTPQFYSYTDQTAKGKVIYRLKQEDFNGAFAYSPTIEIFAPSKQTFSLEQNYPNPFNPTTNISYQLSTFSSVKLEVFDLLGRKVSTLLDTKQESGTYAFTFNAATYNLSSGVYFYRLQAGGFAATKKMVLAR